MKRHSSCLHRAGLWILCAMAALGAGVSMADLLLDQPPLTGTPGFFSDETCEVCLNSGVLTQVQAEDFTLTDGASIDRLTIWGFYVGGPVPANDVFTVIIHEDAGGLPGPIVSGIGPFNVAGVRTPTGNIVFSVDEYEVDLTIPVVTLPAGTYWVEIYTDSGPDGDFDWELADQDVSHGRPGIAFAQGEAPGVDWQPFDRSLAIRIHEALPLLVTLESFTARKTTGGVLIEWKTAIEIDNAGFRLLRGRHQRTKALNLELATPWIIPAAGNALSGAKYQFTDSLKGEMDRLVYYLEDIDLWGRVRRHGPVRVDVGRGMRNLGEREVESAPRTR